MRKTIILFLFLLLSCPVFAQAILIYGGSSHDQFLGCLNCGKYDSSSIWNELGRYGSKYSPFSIWNKYSVYGGKYGSYSPFNTFTSYSPVLVDTNGNFYGYFTANRYKSKRSTNALALFIIEYWEEISDDVGEAYDIIF